MVVPVLTFPDVNRGCLEFCPGLYRRSSVLSLSKDEADRRHTANMRVRLTPRREGSAGQVRPTAGELGPGADRGDLAVDQYDHPVRLGQGSPF